MAKAGGNPRTVPEGKTQVNFNIENSLLEKVKTIVFIEGSTNTEVYNKAVEMYVNAYEKKNGKIKSKPKGKGLDI